MKRLLFLVLGLVCLNRGEAYADYNFTFTGNDGSYSVGGSLITPSNGNGPLTVTGGSVTGTGSVNNGITYTLVPLTGPPPSTLRSFGGTDLIYDDQLTPGASSVLTGNGLLFRAADGLSYLNIWGNSYQLFHLSTNQYGPLVDGAVSVSAINHAPTISGTPLNSGTVGAWYNFAPTASDQDGNALVFTIANKPSWATFSTATGMLSGTASAGTFNDIQISVSDGSLAATLPAFSIAVAAAGGTGGSGTSVPVMGGWWLLTGMLTGVGIFARRRKG